MAVGLILLLSWTVHVCAADEAPTDPELTYQSTSSDNAMRGNPRDVQKLVDSILDPVSTDTPPPARVKDDPAPAE